LLIVKQFLFVCLFIFIFNLM